MVDYLRIGNRIYMNSFFFSHLTLKWHLKEKNCADNKMLITIQVVWMTFRQFVKKDEAFNRHIKIGLKIKKPAENFI